MGKLLDMCNDLFNKSNLYEVLNITNAASEAEIKRGYYKQSLKVHPDRVGEDEKESATEKFQILGKVYNILSDKDKRAVYDESGEICDEDEDSSEKRDWTEYWRLLYKKITVDDIKEFENKYRESEEELADLKSAYLDYKGDMNMILENMICSTFKDEERYSNVLNECIKKKEVPAFDLFTKENKKSKNKRRKKAEAELVEAEELKVKLGLTSENSLQSLILKNNTNRAKQADDFFSHLEEKYGKPKTKKSRKK